MEKPYKFMVLYRNDKGNLQQFNTNSPRRAEIKEALTDGTWYQDERYKAKLRLYNYLLKTNRI